MDYMEKGVYILVSTGLWTLNLEPLKPLTQKLFQKLEIGNCKSETWKPLNMDLGRPNLKEQDMS